MSQINISNLTFSYSNNFDYIFQNVSLCLDTDWKLGFTGRNGRGKTTFLKLLLGGLEYSGSIFASVNFDYFPFFIEDKSVNTIDVIENIHPDFELWKLNREFNLLKINDEILYRPFDSLSGGEQVKVVLAVLFLKENNFLLIDEPTNHLDMQGRKIVSEYLNNKKGFILVSHDRQFLDNCIDHILTINKTNIEIQKGNFSSFEINKNRQDAFELSKNEKLKSEISRLKDAQKRKSEWSYTAEKAKQGAADKGYIGHKAAKVMKTSKVIQAHKERAVEERSNLLKNIEEAQDLKIYPLKYHSPNLISAQNLSAYYGDNVVFENLSFTLQQGERIAITGNNGSGKSSLLKLILGIEINHTGSLNIGSNLKISYLPQHSKLSGNLKDFAFDNNIDESLFKAILNKLDFNKTQFEKNTEDFSEGQKKKVYLAKSLCEKAHVYIWDEPLNYIDIYSRMQIENLILNNNPTMIYIEHDVGFIDKTATKIIHLK